MSIDRRCKGLIPQNMVLERNRKYFREPVYEMDAKTPRTIRELERVHGLGRQRIDAFGKELLDVLNRIG